MPSRTAEFPTEQPSAERPGPAEQHAEQEFSRFHSPRGGWGIEFSFVRGELCFARQRESFLLAFFSEKPGFWRKKGVCGATPGFGRAPRGFHWRAIELLSGGGMSKTGNSPWSSRSDTPGRRFFGVFDLAPAKLLPT